MHHTVWILTDPRTGELAYTQHGQPEDPSRWRTIGPFAYSTEEQAQRATTSNSWFPMPLGVLEVDAAVYVQALFNGFPPSNTDVLAMDDRFLPLSPEGAGWVDEALGHTQWQTLFEEGSGLRWLDHVLHQVGQCIDLDLDAMRAIGELTTSEDVADEVEQAKQLVMEHVKVAIIPELTPELTGSYPRLMPVGTTFWLHTKGLVKLGLPELEIRQVPAWWVTAAGAELNAWAAYSTQHPIQEGQVLQGGGPVPVLIKAQRSEDPYWKGQTCLHLTIEKVLFSMSGLLH